MKEHNETLDTFGPGRPLDDIIIRLNELAISNKYIFRGYNEQIELLPRIMRNGDFINKERELLYDFEKYGSHYFHASTPVDFMSYAQHFGIPTRLLDFSHNPFVALFFALFEKKKGKQFDKDDNEFYYIRYASIDENICLPYLVYRATWEDTAKPIDSLARKACACIKNINEIKVKGIENIYNYKDDSMKESDQKKFDNDSILFVDPNQANQRIIMQQGLFMFPYTLDTSEHLKILNNHSDYLMIHKNHREKLLSYLDTLGYNTFRLMPDLNSICEAIKNKYYMN